MTDILYFEEVFMEIAEGTTQDSCQLRDLTIEENRLVDQFVNALEGILANRNKESQALLLVSCLHILGQYLENVGKSHSYEYEETIPYKPILDSVSLAVLLDTALIFQSQIRDINQENKDDFIREYLPEQFYNCYDERFFAKYANALDSVIEKIRDSNAAAIHLQSTAEELALNALLERVLKAYEEGRYPKLPLEAWSRVEYHLAQFIDASRCSHDFFLLYDKHLYQLALEQERWIKTGFAIENLEFGRWFVPFEYK
jgi:hypothetical protein